MLKVFLQQIKQTCYVVHLDSTVYDAYPAFDLFSIVHGYKLCENWESLKMRWFGDKFRFLMKFSHLFISSVSF